VNSVIVLCYVTVNVLTLPPRTHIRLQKLQLFHQLFSLRFISQKVFRQRASILGCS